MVTLRREEIFETAVRSKVSEALATGKPVILGVGGESKALLEEAEAGLAVTPEAADELARAMLRPDSDRTLSRKLGENGIRVARRKHARAKQATEYLALLVSAVRASKDGPLRPRSPGRSGN